LCGVTTNAETFDGGAFGIPGRKPLEVVVAEWARRFRSRALPLREGEGSVKRLVEHEVDITSMNSGGL
jgi:hypothetical protein